MAELDVNQMRMIKRLHLSKPSYWLSSHPSDRSAWISVLDPSCIRPLEGLHTLHLCVNTKISYDLDPWSMDSHYDARSRVRPGAPLATSGFASGGSYGDYQR